MSHESVELELYIVNTSGIYFGYLTPVLKNLSKHWVKGNFSKDLAFKSLMRVANSAAQNYRREHGSMTDVWHKMFNVSDRERVAESLFDSYIDGIKSGEYLS